MTFRGNSATRRETVENFLLLRSAEVTRDAGYAWFAFDTRDTEAKTTYHTDFAGWPGWGPARLRLVSPQLGLRSLGPTVETTDSDDPL